MTPEENEELKILQYLESRPSLAARIAARILGKLKRNKKEKPSIKKTESSRETIKIAQRARWSKRESNQSTSSDSEPL